MTTHPPATWRLETDEEFPPRAAAALVIGVLVTLYAVALLLIGRRMMGAFTAELSWQTLLVTALTIFAIITGARILWRRTFPEAGVADQWVGWGASLTFVLLASGLSFPGQQERDWWIWLPLLAADQFLRWKLSDSSAFDAVAIPADSRLSGEQFQQLIRTRAVDGRETINATLRADFQTGQRHATVYVGFCPPLATMPEIIVEATAGPAAELKIVLAFTHGARIDVRLAQAALEPTSIALNLVAH